MFEAWGRAVSRRRRLALVITFLFVAFAGAWGTGVFGKLSSGDNFTPPSSPSQREATAAEQVFGQLVGPAPAAPPVRQVRDQGGQPGAGPGAGRRGELTGRQPYPRARATGLRVQC